MALAWKLRGSTAAKWSVGIRGFGTRLSRAVLVLIDGAQCIHAAVRRNLLGSAGHVARGYRPDRTYSRSRRRHMGTECGEWRDQYHHKIRRTRRGPMPPRAAETKSRALRSSATAAEMAKGSRITFMRRVIRERPNTISLATTSTTGRSPERLSRGCARGDRDDFTVQGDIYNRKTANALSSATIRLLPTHLRRKCGAIGRKPTRAVDSKAERR
jgi:hypothetical protein